jgi:DNA-binding MarR family transcriptional regulator
MAKEKSEERTPQGAAITELIVTIFRCNGRLLRSGDIMLRDLELTSARWQVLAAIVQTPRTVAQIARYYELTRQGVLWVVQSMLKDGIVELAKNPDHKRAKLVRLTEKGREVYDEIDRRQRHWSNEAGTAFSVEVVQAATECVRRLGEISKGDPEEDE